MQLKESSPRCACARGRAPSLARRGPRRERLLLAHAEREYRARVRWHFREGEIECVTAASADEAHRLTRALRPALIVLDSELPDESGYLACAKIKLDLPRAKVVLLGPGRVEHAEPFDRQRARRFARFVGAELMDDRTPSPACLSALAV
jgi:CheY-like chemotaxis protein